MLVSGHLLDNRYRLDERIATGGMGDVWRGTDVVLGRVVAVKVLKPAMLTDPEFSARFYGEARMLAAFRHPGVVEVYDYNSATGMSDDDQGAYLVMGFVEGEPLSAKLKDDGRLSVAETLSIMAQTADALHAAHQHGTVHRDVKPGNIMVKPNGTVVLVDFGVARSVAVTSVTSVNSIVGTALYMAPEQVSKGDLSPCTDIYALGAVAYHCLSGHPPFEGENALQVALRHLEDEPDPLPADVPQPVRDLIARAMAKNPSDRWASAADFADAALAVADPQDWRTSTGTGTGSLTASSMAAAGRTAHLTRAATSATVPVQRTAPPPARPGGPGRPGGRRDGKRGPILLAAALVVAGGLTAVIAALAADGTGAGPQTVPGTTVPAVAPTGQPTPSAPADDDTEDEQPTRPGNQPVVPSQPSAPPTSRPTTAPVTTAPATPDATPTTPDVEPTGRDDEEPGGTDPTAGPPTPPTPAVGATP